MKPRSLQGSTEQPALFDLSLFSCPEKTQIGEWDWENELETSDPEIRRFQVGDRIQAKLPNSPGGVVVEIKSGKYAWSDTLLIEWEKNIPRKQKGTQSAISSGKAVLIESYPTEKVIDEEGLSGKTEKSREERDEAITQEYEVTIVSPLELARKYNVGATEIVEILSDRFGDKYREVVELKRQQNLPPTQEDVPVMSEPEKSEGDRTPPPSLFPIEEKYGPVESWPDADEGGLFDFLSYPTETSIEEENASGKTELTRFEKGDRVRSKFTGAIGTITSIIRVEDLEVDRCDRLTVHWDPGQSNVASGQKSPESADSVELIDSPSYPTETGIDANEATGKTNDEVTDRWGFWINTAADWDEFYWRGNQPTIETSAQECVVLEDRGDRWLVVPVGKRPISQEGDGFSNGCVKPYEIYKSTLSPDPPESYPTESVIEETETTGKTIREQILPMSIAEKRQLLIWLQETIKDEAWTPPPVKSGRQIVGEPVKTSKGYRRQELVRCGKATCKSCPHGPYWYEYWSEGGKRRSKYLGKNP